VFSLFLSMVYWWGSCSLGLGQLCLVRLLEGIKSRDEKVIFERQALR